MSEADEDPKQWELLYQQAVQLHESGDLTEAGRLFSAIVGQNPGHFPSLHRLATIRQRHGQYEESIVLLRQAIGCFPSSADAHNSLGNTYSSMGQPEQAIDQYRCALVLRPAFPEAQLNLGNSLKTLGRNEEAVASYSAAIALRPQYVEAHTNLGTVLLRMNRPQEAIANFAAAVSIDPETKAIYSNLGAALTALNRHEEAIPFLQRAGEGNPDAAQPVYNEAVARLAIGDFERGWPAYEARWRMAETKSRSRDSGQPMWNGEAEITGKTVLVHAEQGLGDSILFARYVPLLVHRGARVILEVQKPLVSLMRTIPGVDQVLKLGEELPEFDLHVPFGSLPLAFKTTLDNIPAQVPYLGAPDESSALSGFDRGTEPQFRVGVCWAGNRDFANDYNRSIPLSKFQRLLSIPDVHFVSLQPELRPGDDRILADLGTIDLTSVQKVSSMADTAALISTLDLVITVDSAVAHLTGALGRPVWVLLPYFAYWVWLRYRTDSPWYPTARLFRQHSIGDWESVIERISEDLKQTVSLHAPRPQ
ncbi:MAG: tetratricopeptide repeat-containing glycosyltransferase family protein [Bryobacteraceae bacterium]